MARLVLAAVLILLALPCLAVDAWWDSNWHYRVRVDVNASGFDREGWIFEETMDFSGVLGNLSAGKHLDPNSIRVLEYRNGKPVREEVSQFDMYSPGSWGGEMVWRASGTFIRNTNRTYYIYFDVLENGEKRAPGYERGVQVTSRGKDIRLDSAKFMLYMDKTNYGFTHVSTKSYDWQNMPDPSLRDPFENSRENISRYRGSLSLIGDHFCDPGCERSISNNLSGEIVNEGPLRVAVRSYYDAVESDEDDSAIGFEGSQTTYLYADKPFYRTRKVMRFDKFPMPVSGMNRRMWFLHGRAMRYAYESTSGKVVEGNFPTGGREFTDWNGTWDDALGSDNEGIANFEMLPVPKPNSLWLERDTSDTTVTYLATLWRPDAPISTPYEAEFVFYFHKGDWREAELPTHYWELNTPPEVGLGSLSDFLLKLRVPAIVLNWDPTVRVEREITGSNITIEKMECKMYSDERKITLFEGEIGDAGISVFDVPEGSWTISCVAFDQHGHAATDVAQTHVYDVMTLLKVCGASLLLILLLAGFLTYRILRGMRGRGKSIDCPRCGMPVAEGAGACPVCGIRL